MKTIQLPALTLAPIRRSYWLFPLVGLDIQALGTRVATESEGNLISSQLVAIPNLHAPVLDIDQPVRLKEGLLLIGEEGRERACLDVPTRITRVVKSKTPGHHHVFIDVALEWQQYLVYLLDLLDHGVIQHGFYNTTVRRGMSSVRIRPWEKNTEAEEVTMAMLGYRKSTDGWWTNEPIPKLVPDFDDS